MYFDAVLDADLMPVFNGTRTETLDWLAVNPAPINGWVCPGEYLQLWTVSAYQTKFGGDTLCQQTHESTNANTSELTEQPDATIPPAKAQAP